MAKQDTNLVRAGMLARLFGVSERRVRQMASEGIIPAAASHGRYDQTLCVQGYVRHLKTRLDTAEHGNASLTAERQRLTSAKADMADMERKRLDGELVPISQITEGWLAAYSNVRTRILAIPDKLAPRIATVHSTIEAAHMLRAELYEALTEIATSEPPGLTRNRKARATVPRS